MAFFGAPLTQGQERGETPIGGAAGGQTNEAQVAGQAEPGADHQPDASFLGGDVGAHDAGQRIAIGDGDGRMAEGGGRHDQFLRVRSTAQETEVAGHL